MKESSILVGNVTRTSFQWTILEDTKEIFNNSSREYKKALNDCGYETELTYEEKKEKTQKNTIYIYRSIYLSNYLSIYLSIYLPIYLSIFLSVKVKWQSS